MITTGNDCLACFMKQVLTTVKLSTDDEGLQRRIMVDVGSMLGEFPVDAPPPVNAVRYYRYIAEQTGVSDPFAGIKEASNAYILSLEDNVRESIESSADPLTAAIRYAIGGNVLDNASQHQLDVDEVLGICRNRIPCVDHSSILRKRLIPGVRILYLADNCGEIVLDKLLVEQLLALGCEVTVGVRGFPAINDALMQDAVKCGLDRLCPVIDNGADVPGTVPALCSSSFREVYEAAELIIAKGMGNFECLYGRDEPIFFLFTVKCSNVKRYLRSRFPNTNINIGSSMLLAPYSEYI